MSPETQPRRLARSQRRYIRQNKSELRKTLGLTERSPDTVAWTKVEKILRLKLPEYGKSFAPNTAILQEFFQIRQNIQMGQSLDLIKKFQENHDRELLKKLSQAFVLIREIVGK